MMKIVCLLALAAVACSAYDKEDDVLVLHDSDLDDAIKEFPFILVEFYAPWCGHCKRLTPEYAEAASTLAKSDNPIPLAKVDATVETESASKFEVRGYPTLKFFIDGEATEYNGGRTAKEIVTWIKKRTGPPCKDLATADDLDAFKKSADVVVVAFADKESDEFKGFEAAARKSEDTEFGVVTDAAVAEALGQAVPSVVLYKSFDEGEAKFDGDFEEATISTFVKGNSVPLVSTFSQETAQKIFSSGIDSHFLYFNSEKADSHEDSMATLKEVATEFKGKTLFVYVPATEERVLSYFDFSASDLPKAILVSMGDSDMKKFAFDKDITAENIKAHLDAFHSGELKPTLKSEDEPENNDGPVTVIVGTNFDKIVLDETKDVLIEFYAPWCGHCKALAPTWDKLGEEFADQDNIVIAKIDATANDIDHPAVNVRGFPTILWFPADNKASPATYDGGRDLDDLVSFVNKKATTLKEDAGAKKGHEEL